MTVAFWRDNCSCDGEHHTCFQAYFLQTEFNWQNTQEGLILMREKFIAIAGLSLPMCKTSSLSLHTDKFDTESCLTNESAPVACLYK